MLTIFFALCEVMSSCVKRSKNTPSQRESESRRKPKPRRIHSTAPVWPHNAQSTADEERAESSTYHGFSDVHGVRTSTPRVNLDLGHPFDVSFSTAPSSPANHRRSFADYELPIDWQLDYEEIPSNFPSGEGIVRTVKHAHTSELFVIKTVPAKKRSNGYYELPQEVKALAWHLRQHNNIIDFRGFDLRFARGKHAVCDILLEYCDGGDLHDFCNYWRSVGVYVPSMFVLHFIASMSDALAFLHLGRSPLREHDGERRYDQFHAHAVLHQDIKLENVFLRFSTDSQHGMPDIVLGDFGYACPADATRGVYGTPGLYPPEAQAVAALSQTHPILCDLKLRRRILTAASDVYTFGAALYTLLTNEDFDNRDFPAGVAAPPRLARDVTRSNLGHMPSMLQMLQECLAEEPGARCTTEDLWASAPSMKRAVTALYEAGQRVPLQAYGNPDADRFGRSRSSNSSGVSAAFDEDVGSRTEDVSHRSGFTEDFCWCPRHRSFSFRRPGSQCLKDSVVERELVGVGERESSGQVGEGAERSREAVARARSYSATV